MRKEYVVLDETGNVSFNPKIDQPEIFKSFKAAKKRSHIIATCAPGQAIKIYELTAETIAPVKPAETSRAHPLEHYR
jgi:hypothetical protein